MASRRGLQSMSPYFLGNVGYRTVGNQPPPVHDIKIIKQTVLVNKNTNVLPGAQPRKTPAGLTNNNIGSMRNVRLQQLHGGHGHLPGAIALAQNGRRFFTGYQALGQPSAGLPFKVQTPQTNSTASQQNVQGSVANPNGQAIAPNNKPTNIIIYRKGKKGRPIIIQTKGQVTLSKVQSTGGETKIVISRNPSAKSQLRTTTTTLKPGEDPPELEEIMANPK